MLTITKLKNYLLKHKKSFRYTFNVAGAVTITPTYSCINFFFDLFHKRETKGNN